MPKRKKVHTLTLSLSPSSRSSSKSRSPVLRRRDPPDQRSKPSRSAATTKTKRHIIIGDTDSSSESDAESESELATVTNRLSRGRGRNSRSRSKKIHQNGNGTTTTKKPKATPMPKNKKAKIQKSPAESLPRAKKSLQRSPASRNIMDYFNKLPKNKDVGVEPLPNDNNDKPNDINESMESIEDQPSKTLISTSELKVNGIPNGDIANGSSPEEATIVHSEEFAEPSPSSSVEAVDVDVPHVNGVAEIEDTSASSPEVQVIESILTVVADASPENDIEAEAEIEPSCPEVVECSSMAQSTDEPEPTSAQKREVRARKSKAEGVKEKVSKSSVPDDPEPESELGRRRSSRIAMQRNIRSYFVSDKLDRPSSPESSPEPPISKRKSGKVKTGASKAKKSASSNSQSSSAFSQQQSQSPVTRVLDKETRDFLYSGVPSTILKAQRQAEKKREQDSWLEVAQFFPTVSHVHSFDHDNPTELPISTIPQNFNLAPEPKFPDAEIFQIDVQALNKFLHKHTTVTVHSEFQRESPIPATLSCCPIKSGLKPRSDFDLARLLADRNHHDPFVLKHAPVDDLSTLATDPSAVHQFSYWLQTWKDDITESGGANRRQLPEPKRKRRGSDSEFVSSDEDDGGVGNSERKKSVVMYGPTGCGKSALIYTVATMLGFKVVEINFSSRRSGREVMEMVEEATLSRRLHEKGRGGDGDEDDDSEAEESSDSEVEVQEESQDSSSSQNHDPRPCLLLFEDVNLVQEEDEGFHRAIVQLIQSSVRPIVMTISTAMAASRTQFQNEESTRLSLSWTLDPKIEKTDPLWIACRAPRSDSIVKALQRIVRLEFGLGGDGDEDEYVSAVLGTIAQHTKGDIRQAVNQLQFYMNTDWFLDYNKMHQHFCGGIVQDFEQQAALKSDLGLSNTEFSAVTDTKEKLKTTNIKKLASVAEGCSLLADLDCISTAEMRLESESWPELSESKYEYGWEPRRFDLAAQSNFIRRIGVEQASSSTCTRILAQSQYYTSLLYEPVSRQETRSAAQHVRSQLAEYLDDDRDFEAIGWLRTIVKQSILNSLDEGAGAYGGRAGSSRRRNGRVKHYFNRMSHELIGEIETTLHFESVKQEAVATSLLPEASTGTATAIQKHGVHDRV